MVRRSERGFSTFICCCTSNSTLGGVPLVVPDKWAQGFCAAPAAVFTYEGVRRSPTSQPPGWISNGVRCARTTSAAGGRRLLVDEGVLPGLPNCEFHIQAFRLVIGVYRDVLQG
ncbi:hypothetical protein BIW11_05745 [Tropilaelaps mercedesae]|uniref:Uncharacterized protein n=1 Tax=Tropilaelaps mercedesae TaxID=418985 RepID=A0A1V9Y118_9ACAR|nr:hypothetical protein BIW11_05745 [Tropilaelaps mercedesae]